MDEKYLHLIWEMKRFPSSDMRSVDGKLIEIQSFGIRNDQLAGPDFFYGKIRVEGITHCGMIEIHVKSSDWYAHKHDKDPRYNNVILHVVHEYDRKVIQNNSEILTIELKQFIDPLHYRNYKAGLLKTTSILCRNQLAELPGIYLESMKAKALIDKLDMKTTNVIKLSGDSRLEVLFGLISLAFGTGVNVNGFERIILQNPAQRIFRNGVLKEADFKSSAERALNEYALSSEWHVKGVRPPGNPHRRVKQLVDTLSAIDMNHLIETDSLVEVKSRLIKEIEGMSLSGFMKYQLIINVMIPYLWYLGLQLSDDRLKESAIQYLEALPAENNRIVRHWTKQGVTVKSAYDSQSLIALFKYYCSHKNCLSCEVGIKLMKR